ncbi:MAG: toxin-antitoxin system, antitoxin component, Xre family protein [Deltaproteobacteria bacterium]|nr:toxin-antitoxin system, antitoxin component, Xre family protein [Deltaproteobacteria bacterium]
MQTDNSQVATLIEKIRILPPEKLVEVEDFVDFLRQREDDRRLIRSAAKLSEAAFQKVWDNPDDAEYDLY